MSFFDSYNICSTRWGQNGFIFRTYLTSSKNFWTRKFQDLSERTKAETEIPPTRLKLPRCNMVKAGNEQWEKEQLRGKTTLAPTWRKSQFVCMLPFLFLQQHRISQLCHYPKLTFCSLQSCGNRYCRKTSAVSYTTPWKDLKHMKQKRSMCKNSCSWKWSRAQSKAKHKKLLLSWTLHAIFMLELHRIWMSSHLSELKTRKKKWEREVAVTKKWQWESRHCKVGRTNLEG